MGNYNTSDFLSDRIFIEWRLTQSAELDEYWAGFLRANPGCEAALQEAVRQFSAVRINEYRLDRDKSERLLERIRQSSIRVKRNRRLVRWSAAACMAVLIASAFILINRGQAPDMAHEPIVGRALPPQDIQLIAGDNIVAIRNNADISLSEEGRVSIVEAGSEETAEIDSRTETINTLIVPWGKRSTLTLSDGTKIWLNAGTTVEFPAKFPANERNIKVNGEIFLDVVHDEARPFFVHADQLTVRVFGTRFNVSSYSDSDEKSVVLVDGKVLVLHKSEPQMLDPGDMFLIRDGVAECRFVDTESYTSWTEGILRLKRTPVSEILDKIGRYYNVKFHNPESSLLNMTCSGTLVLSENMKEVILSLCLISGAGFEIVDDAVYIYPQTGK